jgi:hypothetical protein
VTFWTTRSFSHLPIYCLNACVAWRWVEPPTPANTETGCVMDIALRYFTLAHKRGSQREIRYQEAWIGYSGSRCSIVDLIDLYTFRRILYRRNLCSLNNMTMYYGRAVQLIPPAIWPCATPGKYVSQPSSL